MSCIRFNTPAQERQWEMLRAEPSRLDGAVSQFRSPEVTDTKLARLRRMASDKNAKIRESAALNVHTPEDVLAALAKDSRVSVRVCVARNEATPCDVLRALAADPSPDVRRWVAVNYFVPADVMEILATDADEQVRSLVRWKASLAESTAV